MSPLIQASLFLLDTIFTFFMVVVLLRILLQWVRADFYNPICQWILKITNFFIIPLRRVILAYYGIDWASFVALFILAFLKQGLLIGLQTGIWVNSAGLLLLGVADILNLVFYLYLFAIIITVIISWLNPVGYNPLIQITLQLVLPPLNRIRRLFPQIAGLDLSPMIFTIILILMNILIIQVIANQGLALIIP